MTPTPSASPLDITTSDGLTLEAEVAIPSGARSAAVLAHPHPLNGGSMHSSMTDELFRSLPTSGIAVLRFNFRGVEGSEGAYGGAVDEQLDIEAAIAALSERVPDVPLSVAGWSFGSDVALRVTDARLAGWFLIAPPLAIVPLDEMTAASDPRPKLLAVPEHDEFRPPDSARQATAEWRNTEVDVIAGAGHFLVGHTAAVADRAAAFLGNPNRSGERGRNAAPS